MSLPYNMQIEDIPGFIESLFRISRIPCEKTDNQVEAKEGTASTDGRRSQEREGGTTNAPPTSLETLSKDRKSVV